MINKLKLFLEQRTLKVENRGTQVTNFPEKLKERQRQSLITYLKPFIPILFQPKGDLTESYMYILMFIIKL